MHLKGGCLCGSIRYEVNGKPTARPTLCHCSMCQRACGSPMVPWASFPKGNVVVTKGRPKQYKSSNKGIREFCPTCGSQLFFRDVLPPDSYEPPAIDIATASLDDPDALPPAGQIYAATMRPWLKLADSLPVQQ